MRFTPLLWLCIGLSCLGNLGAAEGDPTPPQTLPIIYDQPGGKYILRVDNRRYQIPNDTKEAMAKLIAGANYSFTKNLYDALLRALIDKNKADRLIKIAEQAETAETNRMERLRQTLEALRAQSLAVRNSPLVDLVTLTRIDNEIVNVNAAFHRSEDLVDKAKDRVAEVRKNAEPAQNNAKKAQDDYAAALKDYNKTLADIKALAIATGSAL
mgnify:CR=1 FL=1